MPASSLGDYMGAKAHVVIIPLESKAHLHVHPKVHQDELVLHTSFGSKDTDRMWIRLLLGCKLYTFDFVLF
ncbi:hypothetical protein [Pontibacter rugosus]|uniref:Uncharacterized protein n=1 Tax=Pontibacter rugosus TaxID=1745966 RepID=A0ABW3SRE1_9BACT